MDEEKFHGMLFVSASEQYGDKYIEHLLEQYKIYLNSAEKISDRRQKANEFFLALNTGLVTLLGLVSTWTAKSETLWLLILAAISGVIMCYLWYRIVRSYDGLNSGKFRVIHAIEGRLPLALYDTEWETLGRGKDKNIYWPFTHIERRVPWIFIALYLIIIAINIPWAKIVLTCFK
jgi:hypothetical protein